MQLSVVWKIALFDLLRCASSTTQCENFLVFFFSNQKFIALGVDSTVQLSLA